VKSALQREVTGREHRSRGGERHHSMLQGTGTEGRRRTIGAHGADHRKGAMSRRPTQKRTQTVTLLFETRPAQVPERGSTISFVGLIL